MSRAEQMEMDTLAAYALDPAFYKRFTITADMSAHVITSPRPSCLESKRVRVTLALRNMVAEEKRTIEGVETRLHLIERQIVYVIGGRKFRDIQQAVDAIMEATK